MVKNRNLRRLFVRVALVTCVCAGAAAADTKTGTWYVRDANGNVMAEYDENGRLMHFNLYGLDLFGRLEPETDIAVAWKKSLDGTNWETSGEYATLNEAVSAIVNKGATGVYNTLEISSNKIMRMLTVTQSNLTIKAGDIIDPNTDQSTGKKYNPAILFEANEDDKEFVLVDENQENVTIDGVDVVVKNPSVSTAKVVIRGDNIVIRNAKIQIQSKNDWVSDALAENRTYTQRTRFDLGTLNQPDASATLVWVGTTLELTRQNVDFDQLPATMPEPGSPMLLFCDETSRENRYAEYEVLEWEPRVQKATIAIRIPVSTFSNAEYVWMYYGVQ